MSEIDTLLGWKIDEFWAVSGDSRRLIFTMKHETYKRRCMLVTVNALGPPIPTPISEEYFYQVVEGNKNFKQVVKVGDELISAARNYCRFLNDLELITPKKMKEAAAA
jgi:hypothetical protein